MKNYSFLLKAIIISLLILAFIILTGHGFSLSQKIMDRIIGPFHLRILFQPLVAILFGIKDGRSDARNNAPPFLVDFITKKNISYSDFRQGFNSVFTPLLIGIVLDIIVQYILFGFVRILGAVLVGLVLIGLPYSLSRGLTNRIFQRVNDTKSTSN